MACHFSARPMTSWSKDQLLFFFQVVVQYEFSTVVDCLRYLLKAVN